MADIVPKAKISEFVAKIKFFEIKDIGMQAWLEQHINAFQLSQQATLEAKEDRPELVKEEILKQDKLSVLLHHVYCIDVWKKQVLTQMQDINAKILIYAILYHEDSTLTLIELIIYHERACESLSYYAVDLIDYCINGVYQLIGIKLNITNQQNDDNDDDDSTIDDIQRTKNNLSFSIGLRCISTLFFMTTNYKSMPVSAMRHLVNAKDLASLLVQLLDYKPWLQLTRTGDIKKYIDHHWRVVKGNDILNIVPQEGQAWLCLRQLLLTPNLMDAYAVQLFISQHFAKCMALLTDSLLDQVPVLTDLKQFLCQYKMSNNYSSNTANLHLIDIMPMIYERVTNGMNNAGGADAIAKQHMEAFTNEAHKSEMTARLSPFYCAESLAKVEVLGVFGNAAQASASKTIIENKCSDCSVPATKRCSACGKVYYCSRICQKRNWRSHKRHCRATRT